MPRKTSSISWATVGFPITRAFALHAGLDLPLQASILSRFYLALPILVGGGMEYSFNDRVSLNLRLRAGPSLLAGVYGNAWAFGLDAQLGVAVRL